MVEQILVTPPGFKVIADGKERVIDLPYLNEWKSVDEKQRRIKSDEQNSLWNPRMQKQVDSFEAGKGGIDLACGWQIRMGWSTIVSTSEGIIFSQFDSTHPNNPNKLTPPAGIWQNSDPITAALAELGQEIIVKRGNNVGYWYTIINGAVLFPAFGWIVDYAKQKGLVAPKLDTILAGNPQAPKLEIKQIEPPENKYGTKWTLLRFGSDKADPRYREVTCLTAFEARTGSIEGMLPYYLDRLPSGIEFVDGERLPDGNFRNSKIVFAKKGLLKSSPELLTSKALVALEMLSG